MYTTEQPAVGQTTISPDTAIDPDERQWCMSKVYAFLREIANEAKAASRETPRDESQPVN